jgi:hypothetical protein
LDFNSEWSYEQSNSVNDAADMAQIDLIYSPNMAIIWGIKGQNFEVTE